MMKPKTTLTAIAMLAALAAPAWAQDRTPAPEGAEVYFVTLEDGATVSSPVMIDFGLSGMGVAPAGHMREGSGHHHLLINRAPWGEGPDDGEAMELGLPTDDNHMHFGGGQTSVSLDLHEGTHTLQLLLGDHDHVPHEPAVVSERITITVN